MTDDEIRRIQGEHLVMIGSREAITEGAIRAGRAIIAQARAELIAERDAAFNRGMFVAAGIVITAYDQPTIAGEIIRAVGPAAVKDVDEYDAGVLAPHFPQFAPYAPKE